MPGEKSNSFAMEPALRPFYSGAYAAERERRIVAAKPEDVSKSEIFRPIGEAADGATVYRLEDGDAWKRGPFSGVERDAVARSLYEQGYRFGSHKVDGIEVNGWTRIRRVRAPDDPHRSQSNTQRKTPAIRVTLPPDLLARIDAEAGERGRSAWLARAAEERLERERTEK